MSWVSVCAALDLLLSAQEEEEEDHVTLTMGIMGRRRTQVGEEGFESDCGARTGASPDLTVSTPETWWYK